MKKKLYLVVNIYEDLNEGELGPLANQFYFAYGAEEAALAYVLDCVNKVAKTVNDDILINSYQACAEAYPDYELPSQADLKVILIDVDASIVAVYLYNDHMGDWEDIDYTETIKGNDNI